jgi:hypothetical protein
MLPVNIGEGRPRKGRYQTRKSAVGGWCDVSVLVLDRKKKPLMPCSEKRARLLLTRGKAVVDRMYPFTIRLKQRVGGEVQPVRVKLDPGAKVTGVAIVREEEDGRQHVLDLAEIAHKGALGAQADAAESNLSSAQTNRPSAAPGQAVRQSQKAARLVTAIPTMPDR